MTTGTKSLLWGVHHWLYHPLAVALAWRRLYGRWPSWRVAVCIVIHDWGYWGCARMEDAKGETHPVVGAAIARRLFGPAYGDLVLLHSRHLARALGRDPSRLCWADKYAHAYYPAWWYLLLARLSGELAEYRDQSAAAGFCAREISDATWFRQLREHLRAMGETQNPTTMPYMREVPR